MWLLEGTGQRPASKWRLLMWLWAVDNSEANLSEAKYSPDTDHV